MMPRKLNRGNMSVSYPVGDLKSSRESVLQNYSRIFSSCVPCREANKGCGKWIKLC